MCRVRLTPLGSHSGSMWAKSSQMAVCFVSLETVMVVDVEENIDFGLSQKALPSNLTLHCLWTCQ